MTGLLDRVAGLFVEPVPAAEQAPTAPAPLGPGISGALASPEVPAGWLPPISATPPADVPPAAGLPTSATAPVDFSLAPVQPSPADRVGVVCVAADAALAGAATGLTLIRGRGASCAVVAVWSGEEPRAARGAAPVAAARRLAAALGPHAGCAARATGRLIWLDLPAGEHAAAAAAEAGLRRAAPGVLVVAGARTAAMERALSACDLVLLATRPDADDQLIAVTREGLTGLGPPVRTLTLHGTPAALALCRRGFVLPGSLRGPLEATLNDEAALSL